MILWVLLAAALVAICVSLLRRRKPEPEVEHQDPNLSKKHPRHNWCRWKKGNFPIVGHFLGRTCNNCSTWQIKVPGSKPTS